MQRHIALHGLMGRPVEGPSEGNGGQEEEVQAQATGSLGCGASSAPPHRVPLVAEGGEDEEGDDFQEVRAAAEHQVSLVLEALGCHQAVRAPQS